MTFLGMRKYPTPVQKPMMPFFIGGVVMFFAMNSLAGSLMESDEWKHDPRNPKGESHNNISVHWVAKSL